MLLAAATMIPPMQRVRMAMAWLSPPYAAGQRQVRSPEFSHLQTSTASKNDPARYCASRTVRPLHSFFI